MRLRRIPPYAGLPALLVPSAVYPGCMDSPFDWSILADRSCRSLTNRSGRNGRREPSARPAQFSNAWIGATSQFMRQHLIGDCDAPSERIIDSTAGIDESYLHDVYAASSDSIAGILAQHGVPTDRPLFVAFGRAQWYKGLDAALRVGKHLQQEIEILPVVLAKDDGTPGASDTLHSLSELARGLSQCVLLTRFDFDLPKRLMAWDRTAAVGVFSRREPFGLIPSEYRSLGARRTASWLCSLPGGLVEQVTDGGDGLLALDTDDRATARRCAEMITSAASLRPNAAGRKRVRRDYDLGRNLCQVIHRLVAASGWIK